jgi:thymidylate kinase
MLIAFEGIDGAGKTTVINLIQKHFADWRPEMPVTVTSDFVLPAARLLKPPMVAESNPHAQYALIQAARIITCRALFPQGGLCLTLYDRFLGSTIVYQGLMGISTRKIFTNHHDAGLPVPELTVVLDLPVPDARARMAAKTPDGIESRSDDFFHMVRTRYIGLQNWGDFVDATLILDAREPVEQVAAACISAIKGRMAAYISSETFA